MPDPLAHLSTLAEDAVGDIRLIVHDYAAVRAVGGPSRVGRFYVAGANFGDRATQFAIANIVGVVEHYAEQVLLAVGCAPSNIKSWGDKPRAWQNRFGVDIETACGSFAAMRGYYEARNAIMHRRGELTDSQRKPDVYARLMTAGVPRVGFNVVVTEAMVSDCADTCVQCIEEMDITTAAATSSSQP
jgi:hypothetical protein